MSHLELVDPVPYAEPEERKSLLPEVTNETLRGILDERRYPAESHFYYFVDEQPRLARSVARMANSLDPSLSASQASLMVGTYVHEALAEQMSRQRADELRQADTERVGRVFRIGSFALSISRDKKTKD